MKRTTLMLAGVLLVSCAGNRQTGISVMELRPVDTPTVSDRVNYDSYQGAPQNLRFDFAEKHGIEGELRALSLALESVVNGDLRDADRRWTELERSDNADLAQLAQSIRDNLMFNAGDYPSLANRIVGWNAIRHATVELDYANGWYRATEPVARDYG